MSDHKDGTDRAYQRPAIERPLIAGPVADVIGAANGRLRVYYLPGDRRAGAWGVRVEFETRDNTYMATATEADAVLTDAMAPLDREIAVARVAAAKIVDAMPKGHRELLW